ncbi:hypothetical protein L873DRAFT_1820713 [Choiromyces venosus 120613-1]|uniref:Uncharacterized protein n=1 Tax=Choiromyces venosus 120613-1 TaxID=1336337 RepID=A0A3N4IWP8_9PEZI|nr:hypothetical protein L873DRAFT_1820713 [Choiromyces venosus 120613-1]
MFVQYEHYKSIYDKHHQQKKSLRQTKCVCVRTKTVRPIRPVLPLLPDVYPHYPRAPTALHCALRPHLTSNASGTDPFRPAPPLNIPSTRHLPTFVILFLSTRRLIRGLST